MNTAMNTILVIEDDAALRAAIVDMLELADYKVHTASDGLEGVAAALTYRPDLILCDVLMPYLDGYGVLAELSHHTPTVPFIFMSARATEEDISYATSLGANGYLTKPFSFAGLLKIVQTQLQASVSQSMDG